MPAISIRYVGLTDPPPWEHLRGRKIIHTTEQTWNLLVINAGMSSGQPSVTLSVEVGPGRHDPVLICETSLAALVSAVGGLVAMAETQFGWTMPP